MDRLLRNSKTGKNIFLGKFYSYVVIILFSFILYGNTVLNNYAIDDTYVITENKFTQKGIAGIKEIFSYDFYKGFNENLSNSISGGRYRPLSIATFALEYEFFGLNPYFSHFINVMLYSLTCLLIYFLLTKLPGKYLVEKWYNSLPFIATILFIAHPLHTEVIANIKSRDEILSLLFSLLTMWLLWRYLDRKNNIFLVIASFLFFLALLSKESAIVFIIIFPLFFYFFTNYSLRKIILPLIPLSVIIIVFIVLRQSITSGAHATSIYARDLMNYSFAEMDSLQKYATITYTLGLYLKLLFYPHPLTWDYYPYHITIKDWSDISVIFSLLTYILLIYFAFKGLRSKKFLSFCIFIFLIPLSITSNILFSVGTFLCERYIFVSSIGFAMFIAYLLVVKPNDFLKKLFRQPYILLLPVLLLYSFQTITRNTKWKNNLSLFQTDVKTSYNSFKTNSYLGDYFFKIAEKCNDEKEKEKNYELSIQYCEKAFKINHNIYFVNFDLGTIYLKYKTDLNKSIYYLNNALNLEPANIDTYNNLGVTYGEAKQYDKAIEIFEIAEKIAPTNEKVLSNFAALYNNLANSCSDLKEERKYYELALLYCDKTFKVNHDNQLANLVHDLINAKYKNSPDKSGNYFKNTVSQELNDINYYNNQGITYGKAKQYNKAIEYFKKALEIAPDDLKTLTNLGITFGNARQYEKAIEVFEKAVQIAPNDINILSNLALSYNLTGNAVKASEYSAKASKIQEFQKK